MTPRGVGALLAGCLLVLGTTAAACSVAGPQQAVSYTHLTLPTIYSV